MKTPFTTLLLMVNPSHWVVQMPTPPRTTLDPPMVVMRFPLITLGPVSLLPPTITMPVGALVGCRSRCRPRHDVGYRVVRDHDVGVPTEKRRLIREPEQDSEAVTVRDRVECDRDASRQ